MFFECCFESHDGGARYNCTESALTYEDKEAESYWIHFHPSRNDLM
jgi:hypothetical protein